MKEEYDKFWTNERKLRAELLNLSPLEITIIASIVEKNNKMMKGTYCRGGLSKSS